MMKRFSAALFIVCLNLPQAVFAVPEIQSWKTANGASVYFTHAQEIPIVDIRVVFDAGSARDNGKPGVAAFTSGLLREGAGKLDADALAERLDDTGAQLGNGSLRDMAWVELRTLSEEEVLRESMDLLAMILSKPTFPEQAFERDRKNMLVGLQAQKQQPSSIAQKAFMKAIYGDHPYASPAEGTEDSIQAMTLQDVKAHYRQYYVAENATIAIVGAVSRARAEALAEVITRGLKRGQKPPPIPKVKPLAAAKTIHVEHPSSQTHIWIGQPGIYRGDKDYFQLYVGNHSLGGSGLISRLSNEVREKRGYAYSAYSYFSPMRRAGPFAMVAQTKNAVALDARHVMQTTLQSFIEQGISDAQLTASKQNITGGFALRLDSNKKLAENLAMIGFYGLPANYLNEFNANVDAVTRNQVIDAFKRRVQPDKMVTVIVGPKSAEETVNTTPAAARP